MADGRNRWVNSGDYAPLDWHEAWRGAVDSALEVHTIEEQHDWYVDQFLEPGVRDMIISETDWTYRLAETQKTRVVNAFIEEPMTGNAFIMALVIAEGVKSKAFDAACVTALDKMLDDGDFYTQYALDRYFLRAKYRPRAFTLNRNLSVDELREIWKTARPHLAQK